MFTGDFFLNFTPSTLIPLELYVEKSVKNSYSKSRNLSEEKKTPEAQNTGGTFVKKDGTKILFHFKIVALESTMNCFLFFVSVT